MRALSRLILAASLAPALAAAQAPRDMQMPAGEAPAAVTLTSSVQNGEFVIDIGPMDVPAKGGAMSMPEAPPLWTLVPASGWLHGYRVDLVDKDGHAVPQKLLHHVNVIATQRRELFSGIMLRVAAAGPETNAVILPSLIGYDARKGDTLLVRTMFQSVDRAYQGVHVRVHFPFTPSDAFIGDFTIRPFYLDVTPPAGGHDFDIPVGHSETYWEGSPAVPARILGFSGHVHRYATEFRLEDRTANKVLWSVRPDTGADGDPKQLPTKRFLFTLGLGIRADHVYRLTVVYDNPTNAPIVNGGMAALGGVVRSPRGTPWPAIDPNDKDYKLDVWAMWRP